MSAFGQAGPVGTFIRILSGLEFYCMKTTQRSHHTWLGISKYVLVTAFPTEGLKLHSCMQPDHSQGIMQSENSLWSTQTGNKSAYGTDLMRCSDRHVMAMTYCWYMQYSFRWLWKMGQFPAHGCLIHQP